MLPSETPVFADRRAAGRALARALVPYAGRSQTIVLALPRGGVPVAYEVARALHAPLDAYLVRKLGVPGHGELAMGAIAVGGTRVLNDDVVRSLGIAPDVIDAVAAAETREIAWRNRRYRDGRPPPDVRGRVCIVVDDGLATGATMRAAIAALRAQAPIRIVAAAPVAAQETCREIERVADAAICLVTPARFLAVGVWYADFSPTTDDEVRFLLAQAAAWAPPALAEGAARLPAAERR